jgi:hypothetical protein
MVSFRWSTIISQSFGNFCGRDLPKYRLIDAKANEAPLL